MISVNHVTLAVLLNIITTILHNVAIAHLVLEDAHMLVVEPFL